MMDNDDYLPRFDDSEAPLCRVIFPRHATVEAIDMMFQTYVAWAHKHKGIAYFIDMRAFNPLTAPPEIRRVFTEYFARHRKEIEGSTLVEARVVSSVLTQGILTAVDWVTKSTFPKRIFTDVHAAEKWLHKRIAATRVEAR